MRIRLPPEDDPNEGEAFRLNFTLKGFDGLPILTPPISARYRIDNPTADADDAEIQDWAAITPVGVEMSIIITSPQNSFTDADSRSEQREVTIEATFATVTELAPESFVYQVNGGKFYP